MRHASHIGLLIASMFAKNESIFSSGPQRLIKDFGAFDLDFSWLKASSSSAFGTKKYQPSRSRYSPHQGKQECARRVRQMVKAVPNTDGSA